MDSKHQASSSRHPDDTEMKPKGENKEDTGSSTLANPQAAPITIDGLCPLSTALDARVRAGLRYSEGQGWEAVGGRVGGVSEQPLPR